jgi:uncharacterized protein (DUF697 family)
MTSLSDIVFDGAKFIFVGADTSGQPAVPNISSWQYECFGCRIGWYGNKCAIFARDADLPHPDYEKFRDYCKGVQLDYPDVVVPPEAPEGLVAEGFQKLKGFFMDENCSVHRAQYSTLVYEFADNYLVPFVNTESNSEENGFDVDIPEDINDILRDLKAASLAHMTTKQTLWCHAIIHTAAIACAAIAFVPIPVADAIPITGAQVLMVLGLGEVFDNKLTKSDAQVLLKTVAAPLAGRVLSKAGLVLVPGVGWAINGAIAGAITEILGWTIANDFAVKSQL